MMTPEDMDFLADNGRCIVTLVVTSILGGIVIGLLSKLF